MVKRNRFSVFANPSKASARHFPFLIILQSDFHDKLPTTVVAPLRRVANNHPAKSKLNPIISIGEQPYVIMTELLGSINPRDLSKHVFDAADSRLDIQSAIDFLLTGY
jgi:toxin CcdB